MHAGDGRIGWQFHFLHGRDQTGGHASVALGMRDSILDDISSEALI